MQLKNIEQGQLENSAYRRCRQTQCGFFQQGGCKDCSECSAEPFVLKKACKRCYECENVPNALRWGEPNMQGNKIAEKKKEEPMVIEP